MNVTLYSIKGCGYCPEMRDFLRHNNIPFTEIDISEISDKGLLESIFSKISSGGSLATPATEVGGRILLGASQSVKDEILCKVKGACD